MDKEYKKESGSKSSKSEMMPDKECHKSTNMGTMSKKTSLPGQMYVPKKNFNESDFSKR